MKHIYTLSQEFLWAWLLRNTKPKPKKNKK